MLRRIKSKNSNWEGRTEIRIQLNCDKTERKEEEKTGQNSETQIVTKFKNANHDKTKKNSNGYKNQKLQL